MECGENFCGVDLGLGGFGFGDFVEEFGLGFVLGFGDV